MAARFALDTSVLIVFERSGAAASMPFMPDDDVGVPSVVLAEYGAGVELAQPEYRPRMRRFLDGLLATIDVLPYDDAVLQQHIRLLAWTIKHGVARGQHDLIIAATATATNRTLLTFDKRANFGDLPDVTAQLLDP